TLIQKRWFHLAGSKESSAYLVEGFLSYLSNLSADLHKHVVNCIDINHNTVLHYAISYNNMDVANAILNTNVSNVDQSNAAGYSPLMLAALTVVPTDSNRDLLKKLFTLGNVNAKSTDSTGQTPLMLAVGHGHLETVNLLLSNARCDVNVQDADGSSALMCASEKGQANLFIFLFVVSFVVLLFHLLCCCF
ncbi:hypothetical protein HELRODRAFT_66334, partial [Helobdella robusta]|uniref:Uncharacterized protein n=1 Tax=Helobdella robusta TaxID=6412 RepID=T1FYJ9_HELRO